MQFQPQGKKEVAEAVTIAALSALATGVIGWALETLKKRAASREKRAASREKRDREIER